jgi:hypothetical protein
MKMRKQIPNPGSDEAIKQGCICPVMDNAHGRGLGNDLFWINQKCPVHGGIGIPGRLDVT